MASLPATGDDAARVLTPRNAEEQTRLVSAVDRFAEFVRIIDPAIRQMAERIAVGRGSVFEHEPETAIVGRGDVIRAGWVVAENAANANRDAAGLRQAVIRRAEDIAEDFDSDGSEGDALVVSGEAFEDILNVIENPPPLPQKMRDAIRAAVSPCDDSR